MTWLDAEAVAAYLNVSVRQFRERVATQPGFPPPKVVGKVGLRWRKAAIDQWVEQQPEKV